MGRCLANQEEEKSIHHQNDFAGRVSVIVPTMNSSKTIEKCLKSVIEQTYKNIEIFVVDRFSSDDTIRNVSMFNVNIISIDAERTKAKNLGISKSRGEFLLFIDSDMRLQPTVIEECLAVCSKDNKIAGVVIPERSVGCGFWVKVRDFERGLYAGSAIESARFFRKEFVVPVGGFDEDTIFYEESTLPQKIEDIGMHVNARTTSFILHDETNFDLFRWLYKKHYYSSTIPLYAKKYRKRARLQTSIKHRIKLFIINDKWKCLIRHPLLSTGVFILKMLEVFAGIKGITSK